MHNGVRELLQQVADGRMSIDDATAQLRIANEPLPFATIDHDRAGRCGAGEVVFAAGKTPEQVIDIAGRLLQRCTHALVTRANDQHRAAIEQAFDQVESDARGMTLLIGTPPEAGGTAIPIITAGTSDQPVADEAALTCRAMGQATRRINDVGVAGLHRILERAPELREAAVVICIAGMEGALPSVVGGLVKAPVIAVPTSVGYGAAFGGIAAMLGMLNSCATGVVVVNIDNGFGAAHAATMIQRAVDAATAGSG